jgi:hypothetical protein
MPDYSNLPRQAVPAPPVSPPADGSIFFAEPSRHPALQNGNAGGAVDPVTAVTNLIAELAPNRR